MTIIVKHLESTDSLNDAHFVRAAVFQNEQGIDASDDFDSLDESAEQFVAYDGDQPVGTARYRVVEDGVGKVERVAVLSNQRGKKVGQVIMAHLSDVAKEQGLAQLTLDSQLSAAGFYESLGYKQVGEVFEEVGIPHVVMSKDLVSKTLP